MTSISVVVGPSQVFLWNTDQPNVVTIDTTAASLQSAYEVINSSLAKIKQFAAGNGVTLTDASATSSATPAA